MNDKTGSGKLAPQTKRAQGGVGAPHLHEGGSRSESPTGPLDQADSVDTRAGDGAARTGGSPQRQRKDAGSTPRQGGGTQDTKR